MEKKREQAVPQTPVQSEIKVIEELFSYLKNGRSCNWIANNFNQNRIIAPRGGLWTSTEVRRIAENPLYAGIIVIGKTKREFNPLTETHFDLSLPPENWNYFEDSVLSPYRIISPEEWQKVQIRLWKIRKKSTSKGGRPSAEFGPSLFSGMLFCGYCGAPLVIGRGGKPILFRCSYRRLRIGNPKRCKFTFSIDENLLLSVLSQIIRHVLIALFDDCIRVLNEEFRKAGNVTRKALLEKEKKYSDQKNREDVLLTLYEESKRRGMSDTFEDYFIRASEIRKELKSLEDELKTYRDAYEFALKPIQIDNETFQKKIDDLEKLLTSTEDVSLVRTAIKSFIPKIFIKSEDMEEYKILTFQINEVPPGLQDVIKEEQQCIIKLKKSKKNILRAIAEQKEFNENQSKNFFQDLYDNLSERYLSDRLSYASKQQLIPRFWNVIIPFEGKKLSTRFIYSRPFSVETAGFEYLEEKIA